MQATKLGVTRLRFLALYAVLVGFSWFVLFCYSIQAALPFDPIELPMAKNLEFRAFMPQGWKFFTRNPREEQIHLFAKNQDGDWLSASIGTNADPVTYFGLSRTVRTRGIEIGLITRSVKSPQWLPCKEELSACFEKAPIAAVVNNNSPNPSVCGELILLKQKPIPWAWTKAKKKVKMPITYVRVSVLCP
jgi:antimicrobial peptide system SdpA family protein